MWSMSGRGRNAQEEENKPDESWLEIAPRPPALKLGIWHFMDSGEQMHQKETILLWDNNSCSH